jgi:hypothetical protein
MEVRKGSSMDKQENSIVEQGQEVAEDSAWTAKVLGIGAALGALTGLGAAYLLVQQTRKKGVFPEIDAGEGIRLALLLFGLLRSVAMLGSDDRK